MDTLIALNDMVDNLIDVEITKNTTITNTMNIKNTKNIKNTTITNTKNIYIFDLDDCIIMHNGKPVRYYNIHENIMLTHYLDKCKGDKYIYTNGTFVHANTVLDKMKLTNRFKKIYSRDTVDTMKPDYNSALDVQNDIEIISLSKQNNIIFFDDQIVNLKTAKKLGWKTVWIHRDSYMKYEYPYIDLSFPSLVSALRYFI